MRRVGKEGRYYRVCDPTWDDPCDASFSARFGGRWNAPGSFPVLYLNADVETARANAERTYDGEAFGLFDLNPTMRPHLQIVTIAPCRPADALSDAGLAALGLPASYPKGIGYGVCQPIGKALHAAKVPGVACRSAALPDGEELALFDQRLLAARLQRLVFDQWFLERSIS